MNCYVLNSKGVETLAKILAESGKLNGLYVEYGGPSCAGAIRDHNYFSSLAHSPGHGYIRIPVTHAYADGGVVHLSALISRDQLPDDVTKETRFTCVTVVSMGSLPGEDALVCSADIDAAIDISGNAYTTISTSITLG